MIHKTAHFQVKAESVVKRQKAVRKFIGYVPANEPGTLLYLSLQEKADPTQFLHYLAFDEAAAEERHRASEGVMRFTSVLYPELASPGVTFTDLILLATTETDDHDAR